MAMRFAGQENALTLVNSTTNDQLIPDMNLESCTVTLKFDLVQKQYMGEIGPDYREFADGAEVEFKFAHNDALQSVTLLNALLARAQGKSTDEFAIASKYVSPDAGSFRVILRDLHFSDIPLDLSGRKEFLMSTIKASCKIVKIAQV